MGYVKFVVIPFLISVLASAEFSYFHELLVKTLISNCDITNEIRTVFGTRRHITVYATYITDCKIANKSISDKAFTFLLPFLKPDVKHRFPRSDEDGYLVFLSECNEAAVDEFITDIKHWTIRHWSPRSRILIYLHAEESTCNIKHIAKELWRRDILEASLLTSKYILLYNPFTDELFKMPDSWGNNQVNFFYRKMVNNLHGYPIRVGSFFFPPHSIKNGTWFRHLCFRGRELCVRDTVLRHLNATLIEVQPQQPGFGVVQSNGSVTGLRAELVSGRADVAFLMRYHHPSTIAYMDASHTCEVSGFVGVVRRAPEVPEILKLVLAFEVPVWTALSIATLLFPLGWAGGRREDLPRCAFLAWGVLVQQGVLMPYSDFKHRLGFLCWLLSTLVLATAFVAGFTEHLVSRVRLKDVDTLSDFLREDLTLLISTGMNEGDFNERLRGRLRVTQNDMRRFDEIFDSPRLGACTARVVGEWTVRLRRFCSAEGEPLLHVMREDMFAYVSAYEARRGWPLLRALNRAMSALQEAGMPERWVQLAMRRAQMDGLFATPPADGARRLKPAHLQAAVFLLAAGLAVSLMVFAGEFLMQYWTRVNVMKNYATTIQ